MSRNLKRIFYIYTEANVAVMMSLIILIELASYFVSPLFFQPFCLAFAGIAAAITMSLVYRIYRCEKTTR
jgi:hypothetical protein